MEASNPLDAYSQIVSGVAGRLTPKVASLRVPRQGSRGGIGESLGSGVVFTGDGFLLTNAHVVGQANAGTAAFSDGTSVPSSARPTGSSSASSSSRSVTRWAWPARSRPAWSARSAAPCPPAAG
jgi:hypothetical protein